MEPTILKLTPLTLVGFEGRFISAMSPDANNQAIIPPLWHQLFARKAELPPAQDAFSYGACRGLPEGKRRRDDELVYLAGLSVAPDTKVPTGMARWQVPAQTFALFIHRGPITQLSETIAHVHRVWLPSSRYQRAAGPELERYDARFGDGGKDSEIDYLVPVCPK